MLLKLLSIEGNLYSTACSGTNTVRDDRRFYYPNSLIMKARPSDTSDDFVLVFNKMKKTEVFKLDADLSNQSCASIDCFVPQFVDKINDTLFARIDGVVDFNLKGSEGGKSGWLLLLNIEGRPKICFTFEGEDISEEVRHKVLLLF